MTALRSLADVPTCPPASKVRRHAGMVLFATTLVALFAAYLRLSQTYAENSDEANILLMASDLAHGNLFLSGWNVSDVPFLTTELPEIAVLVKLFGLHLNTAHIAAALTYTVVVAVAMLLAKGRETGTRALTRMAIALAIMLAPQPGVGVFVMIFSVGHIGTAAPVMLTWLVCSPPGGRLPDVVPRGPDRKSRDRIRPARHDGKPGCVERGALQRRRRWYVPVVVGLLLAWALMADPLVLVIAIIPLLVVAAVRREAALALAAAAAYPLAWTGGRVLRAAGGYTQQPVPYALDPVRTWSAHSSVALHGLLEMFGAFFLPGNAVNHLGPGNYVAAPPLAGLAEAVAVTRLACVAVAIWGACAITRRFFRRDADLVSQLLLVGCVANLAAYLPSSLAAHTALNAREFAPVLPFAAVMAARMLGDRVAARLHGSLPGGPPDARRGQALAVALAALFFWYGFGLVTEARLPPASNPFARLEAFLARHHLTNGIGGYWDASVVTVGTGGAITIRAVTQGCLQPYNWESKPAWYDPASNQASFVVESTGTSYFTQWQASPAALRRLRSLAPAADPAILDPGDGYTVRAYRGNLLIRLALVAHC